MLKEVKKIAWQSAVEFLHDNIQHFYNKEFIFWFL